VVRTDHLIEQADGAQSQFRYYFAQREAVETVIWLYDVRGARDKFDLLRFDASGAVSSNMFDEDWPRFVVKMATGAGKTKVLSLLIAWSYFHKLYEADSPLARNFLLIAPNIIVLDRLRADFDGLRIFFNDPVLPDNGHAGPQLARRLPDRAAHSGRRAHRAPDGQHLPHQHPSGLSRRGAGTVARRRRPAQLLPGAVRRKAGRQDHGQQDRPGRIVREIDELAVFNDEAHHIHDPRMAWFKCIQDIHHRLLQKTCGWRCRST
jgi:type III restriction enzyme